MMSELPPKLGELRPERGGLTQELGGFVAKLHADDLAATIFPTVRRGIADYVGVLCAAREEPVVGHALAMIPESTSGASQLLVDRGRASPPDAAFVNATAGHALDYDDTGLDGHPSVVLGPVVLAGVEALGLTWRDAVTAYVAGYEVWAELIGRDADKHHGKGWHPTAVFGVMASAAAAAKMSRLDAAQSAQALGIAASMSSGLVANFGSMIKPLQVGWAARNGMLAAQMAERGVTCTLDALESPRGLLAALSPAGRVRIDGPISAGSEWQILRQGLNIKRYPVCYAAHRAIDAVLSIREEVLRHSSEMSEIIVTLGHLQAAMLRSARPVTSLDAKFSIQFVLACALLRGKVGLTELETPHVLSEDIQSLLRLVRVEVTQEQDADDALFSPADQVQVRFVDGRSKTSSPIRLAKGHAHHPLSDQELRLKFMDCSQAALGQHRASELWHGLIDLPLDSPTRI
jgi:aconitate decarboxylase